MSGPDGPSVVVTPRPAASRAQRVGTLLASAPIIEEDDRFELGVEVIAGPHTGETGAFDLCGNSAGLLTPAAATFTSDDNTTYVPFGVYASEKVNAQLPAAEIEQRVRDQLALVESHLVETEFRAGALAIAATPDWPNDYLAKAPTVIIAGIVEPVRALAFFEDTVVVAGLRHMIHATPALATYWQHHGLLRREGNLLLTARDSIVVAGSGYTTGSTGSSAAYLTDVVEVRRGPVRIYDAPSPDVNDGNTRVVIAARAYAVTHDAAFGVRKLTVGHCAQDTCTVS